MTESGKRILLRVIFSIKSISSQNNGSCQALIVFTVIFSDNKKDFHTEKTDKNSIFFKWKLLGSDSE